VSLTLGRNFLPRGVLTPRKTQNQNNMKSQYLLLLVLSILALSGCSTVGGSAHSAGRYQTVVNDEIAVMTDTVTGEAWSTSLDGRSLVDKTFRNPKRD